MNIDIFSNYAERAVNIVLRFFMIPIYLNILGVSAYGLIGFYITISSMMVLLDFGMGYASMKALAESNHENMKDTVKILKSVEVIYLLISLLIGVSVLITSKWIAQIWLTIDDPKIDGTKAIILMAILLLVSWPQSLYQSFLAGQKRFVKMNILLIIVNLIMTAGMLYYIYYRREGVECYFIVMIVCMTIQTVALRFLAWQDLPKAQMFAVPKELKAFFKYASGVSIFSVSSLIFFQAPAFYISTKLSTSELGIYNVALTFPVAMLTLLYPITSASFPRVVRISESQEAVRAFTKSSSLLSIISICFLLMLTINMSGIYSIWLKGVTEIIAVTKISQILLACIFMYACQMMLAGIFLSNGKTTVLASCYLFAIAILAISLLTLGSRGLLGVVYSWLIMNISLTLAVACSFYNIYKQIFTMWAKIMTQNIMLSLPAIMSFVVLMKVPQLSGIYAKFILSGLITTMSFVFPFIKAINKKC